MKLLFTGDINFRGLSEPNSKMCSDILAEILPYFERADFRIINLETPLANKEKHTPIKNGTTDWQSRGFSEEERVESFLTAVKAGAAGIDMQGYTFHKPSKTDFCGEDKYSFTKNNPKEVLTDLDIISKQCELIEKVHSMGAEVLLSCHPGIAMNTNQVVELALFLEKRNPDIIKIVTAATNEDEMLESIKTMLVLKKEIKTPISYHANGALGGLSRILNPALGGQIAFCVDKFTDSSTMEQLDLKTVVDGIKKLI